MAKKKTTKAPAPKTDAPRVPRRPIKPAKKADGDAPAPAAKRAKPAPTPAPTPAPESVTLSPAQKAWATRKANGWKHPGSSASPKPAPEPIRRANLAEIAAQGG